MTDSLAISVHYLTNLDKAKPALSLYLTNRLAGLLRTGSLIDIATAEHLFTESPSLRSASAQPHHRTSHQAAGLSFAADFSLHLKRSRVSGRAGAMFLCQNETALDPEFFLVKLLPSI